MAQCTAKAKHSGERCRRRAVSGYAVCQVHGAGSPKQGRPGGVSRAALAEGRYRRYLPARLAERYEEARGDATLLALRDDIALLDARLAELLGRVDAGETGEVWRALRHQSAVLKRARLERDSEGLQAALESIVALIERGADDAAAWAEIGTTMEQRRRFVESERRRLVEMHQMISTERLMHLLGAVSEVFRRAVTAHIADPDTARMVLASSSVGIAGLLEAQEPGAAGPQEE